MVTQRRTEDNEAKHAGYHVEAGEVNESILKAAVNIFFVFPVQCLTNFEVTVGLLREPKLIIYQRVVSTVIEN